MIRVKGENSRFSETPVDLTYTASHTRKQYSLQSGPENLKPSKTHTQVYRTELSKRNLLQTTDSGKAHSSIYVCNLEHNMHREKKKF
jgi:hypothetical protein